MMTFVGCAHGDGGDLRPGFRWFDRGISQRSPEAAALFDPMKQSAPDLT
jgi:hypothetical protein